MRHKEEKESGMSCWERNEGVDETADVQSVFNRGLTQSLGFGKLIVRRFLLKLVKHKREEISPCCRIFKHSHFHIYIFIQ